MKLEIGIFYHYRLPPKKPDYAFYFKLSKHGFAGNCEMCKLNGVLMVEPLSKLFNFRRMIVTARQE